MNPFRPGALLHQLGPRQRLWQCSLFGKLSLVPSPSPSLVLSFLLRKQERFPSPDKIPRSIYRERSCRFETAEPEADLSRLLRAGCGTPGNIRPHHHLRDSIACKKTSPSTKSYILSSGVVIDRRPAVFIDGCEQVLSETGHSCRVVLILSGLLPNRRANPK